MIEQKFAEYLYNRLPAVYREEDAKIGEPLHRYIQSLGIGFDKAIEDINNFLYLVDPERCPDKFLPYLCRSFGLEYFEDIDPVYQRKFLMNIGEIIKRRGTYSCVRYLIRVLTGLDVDLLYERGYNEDKNEYGRWLFAELQAVKIEDILQIETNIKTIERFVEGQIPYYTTIIFSANVATQILQAKQQIKSAMGQGNTEGIFPFKTQNFNLESTHVRGNVLTVGRNDLIAPFNVENYGELNAYSYIKQSVVQDLNYSIFPFYSEAEYEIDAVQHNGVCISSGINQILIPLSI